METSSLGKVLLTFCTVLVLASYLFMNLSWIVICSGLVVVFIYSRRRFLAEVDSSRIAVEHIFLDEMTFAREPVAVKVQITNLNPTALEGRFEDMIPDGCEVVVGSNSVTAKVPARSVWSFVYSVVPESRGRHTIGGVRMEQTDAFGLHVHRREIPSKATIVVHTRRESLRTARDVARREHFEYTGATKMPAVALREFEPAWVREYVPGDRARDIHWKAFSKLGKLMTKTYRKEGTLETMVMVDCCRSMRITTHKVAKIDHATDLAIQLSRVLLSNYHQTGVAAFDEAYLITRVDSTLSKHQFEKILTALSEIPAAMKAVGTQTSPDVLQEPGPVSIAGEGADGDEGEAFLHALRSIAYRQPSEVREMGLVGAVGEIIARKHGGEMLFVVISDLVSSRESVLSAARLCRRTNNRMLVIQTYDDWYSSPLPVLDVAEAKRLCTNMTAAMTTEAALRRSGASFLRVGPADSTARIVRSIRRGLA